MDQSISQQIVVFIGSNASWAGPLCFVLACAASIVGANFFVPIGTILIATGTLVGAQLLSWTVVLWAAAGAASGCSVSFAIGSYWGPRIVRSPILQRRAALVVRAQSLFESYGFPAIFIGYFSGPLRAVVSATAGVAGMGNAQFQLVNAIAAPVWAAFSVAQGAIVGSFLRTDHPMFLAVPIATPIIAGGLSVLLTVLWNRLRRARRSRLSRRLD